MLENEDSIHVQNGWFNMRSLCERAEHEISLNLLFI